MFRQQLEPAKPTKKIMRMTRVEKVLTGFICTAIVSGVLSIVVMELAAFDQRHGNSLLAPDTAFGVFALAFCVRLVAIKVMPVACGLFITFRAPRVAWEMGRAKGREDKMKERMRQYELMQGKWSGEEEDLEKGDPMHEEIELDDDEERGRPGLRRLKSWWDVVRVRVGIRTEAEKRSEREWEVIMNSWRNFDRARARHLERRGLLSDIE